MKTLINAQGPNVLNAQAELNKSRNGSIPYNHPRQLHDYAQPVIRIDYRGRILYANKASFPVLQEWNCFANEYIPEAFIRMNPELLSPNADFSLLIETKSSLFQVDVISFPESGYIGIYSFKEEMKNDNQSPAKNLNMAIVKTTESIKF